MHHVAIPAAVTTLTSITTLATSAETDGTEITYSRGRSTTVYHRRRHPSPWYGKCFSGVFGREQGQVRLACVRQGHVMTTHTHTSTKHTYPRSDQSRCV